MFHVTPVHDVQDSARDHHDRGSVQRSARKAEPVEFDSAQLLRGERELYIRHGNELYRLRHTRNDKLILTK